MARRLDGTGRRAGLSEEETGRILDAYRLAMRPRQHQLSDDHDPDFLHPARTALILLDDLGVSAPDTIAAGVLAETVHPELAVDPDTLADRSVRDLLQRLPGPDLGAEQLLRTLRAAPETVRLIALAERLDHARHLHLREQTEWMDFHSLTCDVYRPIAEETHPTLARRFRWWCRMFTRRFLGTVREIPR